MEIGKWKLGRGGEPLRSGRRSRKQIPRYARNDKCGLGNELCTTTSPASAGEEGGGVVVEDFLFGGGGEGEGFEFGDVLGHLVYAGAGPVGAPEDFVGDVFDAREIFEELLRGDAADVYVKIFMAADEEEGFGHPERAAAVGEDDGEVGEVDADVVGEDGLGVGVAGAGEDGGAGVDHDGEAVVLGAVVDFAEFGVAGEVGVWR